MPTAGGGGRTNGRRPPMPEIGLALGFVVTVEDDFLRAAVAGYAEITRLLAAKLEGRTIGVRPVLHRHGAIVFLDPPFHFGKQRLSQRRRILHQGRLIGVLGFQMRADCRIEGGRILENLLPVLGPQPGIFVDRVMLCRVSACGLRSVCGGAILGIRLFLGIFFAIFSKFVQQVNTPTWAVQVGINAAGWRRAGSGQHRSANFLWARRSRMATSS